jgi:GNAT superfamily N-acetyltransferase
VAEARPSSVSRRAEQSEGGLIRDLRFASLLSFEMQGDPLAWLRSFTAALPDIDADLICGGRYFVADCGGELIGGAGWSLLPLSFRADRLVEPDGRAAALSLDSGAVLVRGFFLDPDGGRRAAAADLLAHVEADAARAGHDAAELVVPSSAEILYRSLGFRPVRRLALRVDNGSLPLLQMRKRLPFRLKSAA